MSLSVCRVSFWLPCLPCLSMFVARRPMCAETLFWDIRTCLTATENHKQYRVTCIQSMSVKSDLDITACFKWWYFRFGIL